MVAVHVVVGASVIVANLGVGLWGGGAWLLERPSVGFWYALRVAQVAIVVQALLGGLLLLFGREAVDGLHYLYGLLPIAIAFLAEAIRAGAQGHELEGLDFDALPRERRRKIALAIVRRETGIMAVSALVIFGLALRAALTTPAL
jgi:hypothetical protein